MPHIFFVLICLAGGALGRRLQASNGPCERQLKRQFDPHRALRALLLAAPTEASFNPTATGLRLSQGAGFTGSGLVRKSTGPLPSRRQRRFLDTTMQEGQRRSFLEESPQFTEREQALKFFGVFFAIFVPLYGFWYYLVKEVGIDQEYASPGVLTIPFGVGAWLFYGDDGSTEKGLMWEGYQNLAMEEGFVLNYVPRLQGLNIWKGQAAPAESDAIAKELCDTGFARVNNVLSPETSKALRESIVSDFDRRKEAAKEDMVMEARYFKSIIYPDKRWDYKLDFEPPVRQALEEALELVQPTLEKTIGEDAVLFSLAAYVTDPGSPRQPIYFDKGAFESEDEASVVTVAVALQDVANETGLGYIPTTNTFRMHEQFKDPEDGQRKRIELYRNVPLYHEKVAIGDATIRDARTLYFDSGIRAGKNLDEGERRVYFYFSFRKRSKILAPGSLMAKFSVEDCRLDNKEEWLAEDSVLTEIEDVDERISRALADS